MTHWMCTMCGYYLQTSEPPNRCPSCDKACAFTNVTCYRPDCGGEQIDPLLMANTLRSIKGPSEPVTKPKPTQPPSSEDIYLLDIMGGLDEQQKEQFKGVGSIETYEPNAVIFTAGAEARKFYLVERGQVAVASELVSGMRFPVSLVNAGFAFGWSALVPPYLYTATVTAVVKTRALAFEREALQSAMQANPSLGLKIIQNIASVVASRLRTTQQVLVGLLQRER